MADERSRSGSIRSAISSISSAIQEVLSNNEEGLAKGVTRDGMSWIVTSFFLIAQMAGAGFLSLPKALSNTGWLGVPMMVLFCIAIGFSGIKLGSCWVMLEERWPEQYTSNIRQPYMEIAYRSYGKFGRNLSLASVLITLMGGTTVFLVLTAQLFQPLVPSVSTCEWILIFGFALLPFTWMGTPKDFWHASVIAVTATAIACFVVFVELFVTDTDDPFSQYPNPTIASFSLGFGSILFAFGGGSCFPTIQNDMADKTQFWKSIIVAFAGLLALYLPVSVSGYGLQGNQVADNVLLSIGFNIVVKCCIAMEILNLLGTYIITFNPIGQCFEEMLNIPGHFCWKRVALRSSIVILEILVCLAIPDFGLILNLIGGSTVTICSFILPALMYMKLVDNCDNPNWPKRTIPLWERVALWQIIIVGVIGGIASTVTAFIAILSPEGFGNSCFTNFYGTE